MNTLKKMVAVLLVLSLPAVPAAAQDEPVAKPKVSLQGEIKAVKTVNEADGTVRTELVEPDLIVPGDRLMFRTLYTNDGDAEANNVVFTGPALTSVRLAPDADPDLIVSVDGGKTFGKLAELSVVADDGSTRAAAHADVTNVRLTIAAIAPGESGVVEYPTIIR